MKTQEEINEKLTELKDKENGIENSKEPLTNELKVILVASQLQQKIIEKLNNKSEEELEEKLKEENIKIEQINKEYVDASSKGDINRKRELHALEWTCSIKIHTINWLLGNTKEIPEEKLPF